MRTFAFIGILGIPSTFSFFTVIFLLLITFALFSSADLNVGSYSNAYLCRLGCFVSIRIKYQYAEKNSRWYFLSGLHCFYDSWMHSGLEASNIW